MESRVESSWVEVRIVIGIHLSIKSAGNGALFIRLFKQLGYNRKKAVVCDSNVHVYVV